MRGCPTFAEYTVMPEIALTKIDPEAPFEHACLFACGLSTGLGAAINTAAVRPGSTCAGSSFGGVKGREGVPQLIDRCLAGEIDVAPFISRRLALDEVNRGIELMEAHDGIRSVIEFG